MIVTCSAGASSLTGSCLTSAAVTDVGPPSAETFGVLPPSVTVRPCAKVTVVSCGGDAEHATSMPAVRAAARVIASLRMTPPWVTSSCPRVDAHRSAGDYRLSFQPLFGNEILHSPRSARHKEKPAFEVNRDEGSPLGTDALRHVVLVHGGFVDGSGWQGVYESLSRDEFQLSIGTTPPVIAGRRRSHPADHRHPGRTGRAGRRLRRRRGHHRGRTRTRTSRRWCTSATFAPDKDESVSTLIGGFPVGGPQPPILPPRDGFLFLDRENSTHRRRGPDPQSRTSGHVDGRKLSRRYRMSCRSGNRSCSKGRPGKSSGRYHTGHSIRFESRRLAARRERNPGSSCRPPS